MFRHDSTRSTFWAHAFWLCRACRTARLDTLVSMRLTTSNVLSRVKRWRDEPSGIWAYTRLNIQQIPRGPSNVHEQMCRLCEGVPAHSTSRGPQWTQHVCHLVDFVPARGNRPPRRRGTWQRAPFGRQTFCTTQGTLDTVCDSSRSTWLQCAKMTGQIKKTKKKSPHIHFKPYFSRLDQSIINICIRSFLNFCHSYMPAKTSNTYQTLSMPLWIISILDVP